MFISGPEEVLPSGPRFTEVSETAGLGGFKHFNGGTGKAWAPEIVGSGVAFFDYNNDGWSDIILLAGGHFQQPDSISNIELFINKLDGTFEIASEAAGLDLFNAYTIGLAIADYDNDGDQDLFLNNLGRNMLLNNHDGTFTDVAKQAGLAEHWEWGSAALFFDADRDGHLDLFAGNYVDWSDDKDIYCGFEGEKVYCTPEVYDGIHSRFFRNLGNGRFEDQTQKAGFADGIDLLRDKTLGVVAMDYNLDGWTDLFVANDTERDLLYENRGGEEPAFAEVGIRSGVAVNQHGKPRAGMGVDAGVVDGSREVTLLVGNFSDETLGVYRHAGQGLFSDRAAVSKLGHPSLRTLTFGLFLFDAENDGDLDVLAANGHVQTHIARMVEGITFRQPPQLYLNRGNGTFDPHPQEGVWAMPLVARGAAYADYDQDGDLDVLIAENNGPAHLLRNDSQGGAFLQIELVPSSSGVNRDAIGTRVVAVVDGYHMVRRRETGASYLSQSEAILTFGLGTHTNVDSLQVFWPNGQVDLFTDVPANHRLQITEGALAYTILRQPGKNP